MVQMPSSSGAAGSTSRVKLWLGLGAIGLLAAILLIGKFGGFFDPQQLGAALGDYVGSFGRGPIALLVLVAVFCACAFIAVPQFVLIGIAVFAIGPIFGPIYAWIATIISGSLTYWLGRWSGQSVLARVSSRRVTAFTDFVGQNAFLASLIVRNAPAGPFLFVNMVFGAIRASFAQYIGGMGVGIIPKIALVALITQGTISAAQGEGVQAAMLGLGALVVFVGGALYVRHRRREGKNISLAGGEPVDSGA